jgi:Skp1 family, tetramerisation domain
MPKEFVKLISKEGFEFIVDYRAACISNTIKNMLSFDGANAHLSGTGTLPCVEPDERLPSKPQAEGFTLSPLAVQCKRQAYL